MHGDTQDNFMLEINSTPMILYKSLDFTTGKLFICYEVRVTGSTVMVCV